MPQLSVNIAELLSHGPFEMLRMVESRRVDGLEDDNDFNVVVDYRVVVYLQPGKKSSISVGGNKFDLFDARIPEAYLLPRVKTYQFALMGISFRNSNTNSFSPLSEPCPADMLNRGGVFILSCSAVLRRAKIRSSILSLINCPEAATRHPRTMNP